MGIDAMPPPGSALPVRLVLGPALRAQSDRRLVGLVREGYESAFEEIVRRYRRPLDRFAASIVGGHAEDVTQDSFRKALEALRRDDGEVELRPWLYRIVRNTALNDLRDRPPAAAELAEEVLAGGRSAAADAEERAEVVALIAKLRALPEKQRAALVMRELEGMGHAEIAVALGISGGAARQAIARARTALRAGVGALVPVPLVRALASDGGASEAAAGGAIGGVAAAGGGSAVIAGGIGASALKVGFATVVVAGSIGAGVAIQHGGDGHHRPDATRVGASASGGPRFDGVRSTLSPSGLEAGDDQGSGPGGDGAEDNRHRADDGGVHGEGGRSREGTTGDGHRGGDEGSKGGSGSSGGGGRDGVSGGDGGGSGSGRGGGGDSSGSGFGSGTSGSTSDGSGSDDLAEVLVGSAPADSSSSSSSGGSGSGSDSSGGPSSRSDSTTTTADDSTSGGGPGPSGDSEISP